MADVWEGPGPLAVPVLRRPDLRPRGRLVERADRRIRTAEEIVVEVLIAHAGRDEPNRSIALAELVERYQRILDRRDRVDYVQALRDASMIVACQRAFSRERNRRREEEQAARRRKAFEEMRDVVLETHRYARSLATRPDRYETDWPTA